MGKCSRLFSFDILKKKRVLVAPLHWGLGHAARCIPLISEQLTQGAEVIIAAADGPKSLLLGHFPDLEYVHIPFTEITYPVDGRMVSHFIRKGPALVFSIYREHRILKKMVQDLSIDLVISDSRFGCWSANAKCVFVTHQVEIKGPIFQSIINILNRWIMSKYDEVWIPDVEQFPGLAGELSHPKSMPENAKYIGPLSRFKGKIDKKPTVWSAVVMISGPEPQRTFFEAEMVSRFFACGEPTLVLRGKPHEPYVKQIDQLKIVNHLSDAELVEALSQCDLVVARSGYSTIMDLHQLGIKAEFHPTPGQTEQEYLALLHAL